MLSIWGGLALGLLLLALTWDLPRTDLALSATRRAGVTLEAADGRVIATSGDVHGEIVRLRLEVVVAVSVSNLSPVGKVRMRSMSGPTHQTFPRLSAEWSTFSR